MFRYGKRVNCRAERLIQIFNISSVGLSGLGVTCSPRDPRFAGSNSAEVDGFFQDVKILSTSPTHEKESTFFIPKNIFDF